MRTGIGTPRSRHSELTVRRARTVRVRPAKISALAGALALLTSAGVGLADHDGRLTEFHGSAPVRVKSGTGFFVAADGLLATSWHVVNGCTSVTVWLVNGGGYAGQVIDADQRSDVALLTTESPVPQYARVVNPEVPHSGDQVFTLAYGTSVHDPRKAVTTQGQFLGGSATEAGDPILLIRARLHEGNSGGPVIDTRGSLIGMVTRRYTDQPDRAIVVPSAEIATLMSRQGFALQMEPPVADPRKRPRALLAEMTALVQCAPVSGRSTGSQLLMKETSIAASTDPRGADRARPAI
jgi:S1-C subfamily serine protease